MRPVVQLACSRGGHFDLLLRSQKAFEGCRLIWITQESQRAHALEREGAEVHVLGEWNRTAPGAMIRIAWRSLGLVLRQRPRIIVTSGAGIVVPFCLFARLRGARIVFIEDAARVCGPSSSGRILSRLSRQVIAAWDDMRAVYPRATIARASVVEGLSTTPRTVGAGTFVAVGTHSQPFDRLLRMVDRAAGSGILPPPVTAQVGASREPLRNARTRQFLTPDEMEARIKGARYVVSHAGIGTIAAALRIGRRPLVLPRLARHDEHFDDHQEEIVNKLAGLDLVVPLRDEITASDLARVERPLRLPAELERLPPLVDCLRQTLALRST